MTILENGELKDNVKRFVRLTIKTEFSKNLLNRTESKIKNLCLQHIMYGLTLNGYPDIKLTELSILVNYIDNTFDEVLGAK